MNEYVIMIQRVANGYVLTVPMKQQNQLLRAHQNNEENSVGEFSETPNVFIFDTMEKVLAFLAKNYI